MRALKWFKRLSFGHLALGMLALMVMAYAGWYLFLRNPNADLQILTVYTSDFKEQIALSGTVEAAQNVDLGFAQSGRISGIYASVGDTVTHGTLLAETENGDLRAAVVQKQAALDAQQANLASLLAGTRPEQIAVTQTEVANDQVALAQASRSLSDTIATAYTTSDDAVHNKIDQLFGDPRGVSPQILFSVSDPQIKVTVESDRLSMEKLLVNWQTSTATLATSSAALAAKEEEAQANLAAVSAFLGDVNVALNYAIPTLSVPQTTLTTYVTSVGTARTNITTAISNLTTAFTAETAASSALDKDEKSLMLEQAGSTPQDIAGAEAQVASAKADVENAQAQLQKTLVTAPFGGTVTRMDAKVGEVVSPSAPQISMISNGLFQIQVYVPEVEIQGLAVGNEATTTLDAYGPGTPFAANVIAIDPAETVVNGVSTYKTTLQFLNLDPRIKSGMTANVVITTAEVPNALVVPQGAVFQKNGHAVLQLVRGGAIVDTPIETGGTSSIGNIQIVSGLVAGDMVVLNPDTTK